MGEPNEYELERAARIARNKAELERLTAGLAMPAVRVHRLSIYLVTAHQASPPRRRLRRRLRPRRRSGAHPGAAALPSERAGRRCGAFGAPKESPPIVRSPNPPRRGIVCAPASPCVTAASLAGRAPASRRLAACPRERQAL